MTRCELIEELGECLFQADVGDGAMKLYYAKHHYESMATIALDTIFAALKEPTEEMLDEARRYCDVPINTWQAMLNASPLAPKGE